MNKSSIDTFSRSYTWSTQYFVKAKYMQLLIGSFSANSESLFFKFSHFHANGRRLSLTFVRGKWSTRLKLIYFLFGVEFWNLYNVKLEMKNEYRKTLTFKLLLYASYESNEE